MIRLLLIISSLILVCSGVTLSIPIFDIIMVIQACMQTSKKGRGKGCANFRYFAEVGKLDVVAKVRGCKFGFW